MMTQHEARDFCRKLGSGWDLPDSQDHTESLVKHMKEKEIETIWTSLARIKYGTWIWVNDSVCK